VTELFKSRAEPCLAVSDGADAITAMKDTGLDQNERLSGLDGLRGLAILLVLIYHYYIPWHTPGTSIISNLMGLGWSGVDLFFVLSGYLITGILLKSKRRQTPLHNFYIRRILRIFPLYYGTLIVIFGFWKSGIPQRFFEGAWEHQLWWWLYGTNILFSLRNEWIGGRIGHFWTLAIEEHFYLIWPLIIYFVRPATAACICGLLLILSPAARFIFYHYDLIPAGYIFTLCRLDALALGSLIAICLLQYKLEDRLFRVAPYTLTVACLLVIFVYWQNLGISLMAKNASVPMPSLLAIIFASLLVMVRRGGMPERLFSLPALTIFGKYSYGIYVYHYLLIDWILHYFSIEFLNTITGNHLASMLTRIVAGSFISLFIAFISYHVIEYQFLRLKKYFPH
jgi:peptidoglycan/LPS O-acetylase OafA/YrhL